MVANSSDAITLEDLLERYRAGDREAREWFFTLLLSRTRYRNVLCAMARRLLRRGDHARRLVDTQDLVQSALITGLDKFMDFKGETPRAFFGWMRTILRSELNRIVRKEDQRLEMKRLRPSQFRRESPRQALSSSLSQQEAYQRLRAAVAGLPADDRRILELQLAGWNATQIGKIMNLKPACVRKRRSRACQRLRELLCRMSGKERLAKSG